MTVRTASKTFFWTLALAAAAAAIWAARTAHAKPNTDITVESDGNNLFGAAPEPEEKFSIPLNEATELGFNEDGDPAVKHVY